MTTALIIVHPSSLNNYGMEVGWKFAEDLAKRMAEAAFEHDGPVYVVFDHYWDQPNSLQDEFHEEVVAYGVIEFPYGDCAEGWEKLFRGLRRQLKVDRVRRVVLGGVWYEHNKKKGAPAKSGGCVNAVYWWLKRTTRLPVVVNMNLVGQLSDGDES